MTDSTFTPVFLLFGILLGSFQSYLEFLWLRRSFHVAGSWRGMVVVAVINILFVYLMIAIGNSYFALLIFPMPLVPTIYIVIKLATYYCIQRFSHTPVHGPWTLAFLSLFVHYALTIVAYQKFATINPTQSNLVEAIREKNNRLLETMLWIGVKKAPNMRTLVDTAIVYSNDIALEKLIRHGADPKEDYRLNKATFDMMWRITKWKIENGVTKEEFDSMRESFGLAVIVLGHTAPDLEDCFRRGYTFHGAGLVTLAITQQSNRSPDGYLPDEIHDLKEKIRLLVEHGADINGFDVERVNAMFTLIAITPYLPEVLAYVIEKGGDVNLRSRSEFYVSFKVNDGERYLSLTKDLTPLMVAAAVEPRYVPLLLKSGADKAATDARGHTALDYARERKALRAEWHLPAEDSETTFQLLKTSP